MTQLETLRQTIRANTLRDETAVLADLQRTCPVPDGLRDRAGQTAAALVENIRGQKSPGLMEVFLAEYGLSTDEGIALMCLAEALLRVPDTDTIDALIEDKIAPSQWSEHLGKSNSPLVNASTWALMLTGKVLKGDDDTALTLRGAIRRVGEPVIRHAVKRAMKELGGQFVLGETIPKAVKRAQGKEAEGYTYSYDMLGEAALTAKDAQAYFDAYADAIRNLAVSCGSDDIRKNPGISIKLSALHPRYEYGQRDRVMDELVPRVIELAQMAASAGMGFNIDAEEADRLDLSLDVIETVLRTPDLSGWDGFGVVVQAYGKRALPVIDWLAALATQLDRKIMVRLVKGAYWDTEIKRAQVEGLPGFPVFERKPATDVSYICCAQRLLSVADRIYPQFATHNAHSVAAILEMGADPASFEFQRLHGMGEALHDQLVHSGRARSRIYAPVGAHKDLLAYLVRRLLENGANSSFVNQIVDVDVPVAEVVADPFVQLQSAQSVVAAPADLYAPERVNSKGWDLNDPVDAAEFDAMRAPFETATWTAAPMIAGVCSDNITDPVHNPADPRDIVGHAIHASTATVDAAIAAARPWGLSAADRADVLNKVADLYEENAGEFFAILAREAGKTPLDAIAELREAVDFLRYYAARGMDQTNPARGIFTCISPWNFPLAIFTGQIAAALAAGNGVLSKPAEATSLIACRAVAMFHAAGVPAAVLQILPGLGGTVGAQVTATPAVDGVCFTGSTATAQTINRTMAAHLAPSAPLIAETGGLNAMIVDSTALPEQAVKDIVASAFQSAGQRCSALRVLYLQDDIADTFLNMLYGAMDELSVSAPWARSSDVGPIISKAARDGIQSHIEQARRSGNLLKELPVPADGHFVRPTVLKVSGIGALNREVFGPVLHVATFAADDLHNVIADINATGYGLTFGLHTRIDDRVDLIASQIKAGNIYVNRNQIGAIVGSQPFGGEGMSGTGPKAGGPNYVQRFTRPGAETVPLDEQSLAVSDAVQAAIDGAVFSDIPLSTTSLPGPTGESNRLSVYGRGVVLCLGPGRDTAKRQAQAVTSAGAAPVVAGQDFDGVVTSDQLTHLSGFHAVVSFAPDAELQSYRAALAARDGAILPLLSEQDFAQWCQHERHICVDTTAAGGNAALLASAS